MHHKACWGQLQIHEVHQADCTYAAVIAILTLVAWHLSNAHSMVANDPQMEHSGTDVSAQILGHLITQQSAHSHALSHCSALSFIHLAA